MKRNFRHKSILIVEGDLRQNILMQMVLEFGGYAVISAATAEQALAHANSRELELVILDVMLDDEMDGFAILTQFKANTRTASVPVILVGPDAGESQATRALEMGAAMYITKPCDTRHLMTTVRHILAHDGTQEGDGSPRHKDSCTA